MRKLIEMSNEHLVICDNPKCDYKVPNSSNDPRVDITAFLNMPCPNVGGIYLQQKIILIVLNFLI